MQNFAPNELSSCKCQEFLAKENIYFAQKWLIIDTVFESMSYQIKYNLFDLEMSNN